MMKGGKEKIEVKTPRRRVIEPLFIVGARTEFVLWAPDEASEIGLLLRP